MNLNLLTVACHCSHLVVIVTSVLSLLLLLLLLLFFRFRRADYASVSQNLQHVHLPNFTQRWAHLLSSAASHLRVDPDSRSGSRAKSVF